MMMLQTSFFFSYSAEYWESFFPKKNKQFYVRNIWRDQLRRVFVSRLVSPLRRFSKCEWSDLHLSDNNYMNMNETYGKSQRKRKLRKLEISSHEWDERSLELTKLSFADQKASEAPFKTLNLSTIECQKITQIVANFSLLRPICQFCFLSLSASHNRSASCRLAVATFSWSHKRLDEIPNIFSLIT